MVNDLGYYNKIHINNMLDYSGENDMFRGLELRRNCGYHQINKC